MVAIAMIASAACSKKQNEIIPSPAPPASSGNADNYSSMEDFFLKNEVAMQHYAVDGVTGGSFITPQGTEVIIPANAFITQSGGSVTGNVQVEFKDIYKKSDMLLSDKGTLLNNGSPLLSAGEFFIRVKSNNDAVLIANGKKIEVKQPQDAPLQDTVMAPFIGVLDSVVVPVQQPPFVWTPAPVNNTVSWVNATTFMFSLYQFGSPASTGTWCNSDNPWYFSAYPQTTLTLHGNDDPVAFMTDVYLVFKNIKSMIHVYRSSISNNFPYSSAPEGLECTVVAIGLKNNKLQSSFTPIIIGSNQTVNFTLSETTTEEFKAQVEALN